MKLILKLCYSFLILFSFYLPHAVAQTQLKGWHIAPNLIDMQGTTPVVKPPFTVNGVSITTNSIYDSEGKLLFYISGQNVYNKFDQNLGTLPQFWIHQSEIAIIPSPDNSMCSSRYFIVYYQDNACCLNGSIKYAEVNMNSNFGRGQLILNSTVINTNGSVYTPLAVSKVNNGKRFLYYIDGSGNVCMNEVVSSGINSTINIISSVMANVSARELELSNTGDKIVYASSGVTGNVIILPLNPTTGLPTGVAPFIFSIGNVAGGLEFNNAGDKLFFEEGTGIFVKNLTSPYTLTAITTSFKNCMLEKNYNGTRIVCANANSINTIDPSTNALGTAVSFTLPKGYLNFALMPDQIDGENYDATGTINVDVDIYTASTSATWGASNPFFALQQNSYLGSLTGFTTIRVARQINIPNGISITADKMNFFFQTNAEWNVNGGGNLSLTGSILESHPCGLMWRGISVNNNSVANASNFTMSNNGFYLSAIFDAIKGVEVNGANVTTNITNFSNFNKNEKSVVLNSVNPSITSINKSLFYQTSPLKDQTKGQVLSTSGTVRYGITGVESNITGTSLNKLLIGSPTAGSGNYFESGQYGVKANRTDILIQNNTFESVDNSAISADAAFAGARETDIISNAFHNNRTDSWVYYGCHQKSQKNTSTGCREFCMRWHYNYGRKLEIGDPASASNANTFDSYGWAGIAVSDCDNTSTDIQIHYNQFQNAPGAGSVYISEATLTGAASTYAAYRINNNSFSNVMGAVKIINVRGNANNAWNGEGQPSSNFDIFNNGINYVNTYNVNATGIHVENSIANRAVSNQVTSNNSVDWQNWGIRFVNTPNSLIKSNTVQAGMGIRLGLDVMGSNILCNNLRYCVSGIEAGWSWLRASMADHGETGVRGRNNYFLSNTEDMKVFYSYDYQYKWITPNTSLITYVPGGAFGTNIISASTGTNPCSVGSRMAGNGQEDLSYEADENGVTANYTNGVTIAQEQSAAFIAGIERFIKNPAKNALSNTDKLAKAQAAYNTGNWQACQAELMALNDQLSHVEKNIAGVLAVLTALRLEERYAYTDAEQNSIDAIAQNDSRLGGQGVHYARGIMLANFNKHYEDPYQLPTNRQARRALAKNGIETSAQNAATSLYPNPASQWVNLITGQGQKVLTVYNHIGQKVYDALIDATLKIDVSRWNKGMYVAEFYDTQRQKQETVKFMVE